jgi:hypothetical protein
MDNYFKFNILSKSIVGLIFYLSNAPAFAASSQEGSPLLGLIAVAVMIWLSWVLLKWLFLGAKALIGWVGPFIVGALPGTGIFLITHSVFGYGVTEASVGSLITAFVLGAVTNAFGGNSGD